MRSVLFVVGFCVFGVSGARAADFTAEKARALIPEAAGVPSEELQKLSIDPQPTGDKIKSLRGESLVWWVFTYAPGPNDPKHPTSFRFIGESVNPSAVAGALSGPKDKEGKYRKTATLIHPEYITDCTAKVTGATATGVVTFRADKVYEGKVEYTARKKDGAWRIEEFRLPDLKVTLVLGADGKWVKK